MREVASAKDPMHLLESSKISSVFALFVIIVVRALPMNLLSLK